MWPAQPLIRFGRCQARTNSNTVSSPGSSWCRIASEPIRGAPPTVRAPSIGGPCSGGRRSPWQRKLSQNSCSPSHHGPSSQRSRTVADGSDVTRASLPKSTSSGDRSATSNETPRMRGSSMTTLCGRPACTNSSRSLDVVERRHVGQRPDDRDVDDRHPRGWITRYRMTAPGMPESSGSRGMNGVNASSATLTGMDRSMRSTRAKGYSSDTVASSNRGRPATVPGP